MPSTVENFILSENIKLVCVQGPENQEIASFGRGSDENAFQGTIRGPQGAFIVLPE